MPSSIRSQRLVFPGGNGYPLSAQLELPQGRPEAYAVFAPCFTCSKDSKAIVHISRALAEGGVAVLRYDVTGIGASEGDFSTTTFQSQVDDLAAAAGFLRARHEAPSLVLGMSLGGAVALTAAPRLPGADGVVAINAPANLDHLRSTLLKLAPDLAVADSHEVMIVGQRVRIGRALIEDLGRHSILDASATLDLDLLVVASTDDEIVPPGHGERLFAEASQPKSFLSIPGGDHLMLRDSDVAPWVGRAVTLWFERARG